MKKTGNSLTVLHNTDAACDYLERIWDKQTIGTHEKIYLVFMDNQKQTINSMCFATGDNISCSFNMDKLLQYAVLNGAKSVLLAHNHPNNDTRPSGADKESTEELYLKCRFLGLEFYDHIIVTPNGVCASFKHLGILEDYERMYEQMVNFREPGTFEHTVMTLINRTYAKIKQYSANGQQGDYLGLIENLKKVYIKFHDPIV